MANGIKEYMLAHVLTRMKCVIKMSRHVQWFIDIVTCDLWRILSSQFLSFKSSHDLFRWHSSKQCRYWLWSSWDFVWFAIEWCRYLEFTWTDIHLVSSIYSSCFLLMNNSFRIIMISERIRRWTKRTSRWCAQYLPIQIFLYLTIARGIQLHIILSYASGSWKYGKWIHWNMFSM